MIWWGWVALGGLMFLVGLAVFLLAFKIDSFRAMGWLMGLGMALMLLAGGVGTVPVGWPDETRAPAAFRDDTEVCQ